MRLFLAAALIVFVSAASTLHVAGALARVQTDRLTAALPAGLTLADICGFGTDEDAGAPLCPSCIFGALALAPETSSDALRITLSLTPMQWADTQSRGTSVAPHLTPPIRAPPFAKT